MGLVGLHQYLDRVEELLEAGQLEEALAHCHNILSQQTRHVDTYRLLGRILLEQRDMDEALDTFSRVLSVDPEDLVAHAGSAIAYRGKDQLGMALWHMERAAEIDAYNSVIQEELNTLYTKLEAEQGDELSRVALARLHYRRGHFDVARSELQELLNHSPERQDLQVLLAEVLYYEDRLNEAANTSSKVLYILPDCIKANAILGLYYLRTGKSEAAAPYAEKLEPLLLPEQVSLEEQSLAGQLFSTIDGEFVPEKVLVEELDLESSTEPLPNGDEESNLGEELMLASADLSDWSENSDEATQPMEEAQSENKLIEDEDEEVFDWLKAIAEEEGLIIDNRLREAGKLSEEFTPELDLGDEKPSFLSEVEDRLTLYFPDQEIDPTTADESNAEQLPQWLEDVIGFTDNLSVEDPNAFESITAEKRMFLSAVLSGGIAANYRGGPLGSYSTTQLEGTSMSSHNDFENEYSDDLNENKKEDEWLEELGRDSSDLSAEAAQPSNVDQGDLGDVEPGEDVPDWLKADIMAAQKDSNAEQLDSGDLPAESLEIVDDLLEESESDVPEWLEDEISNHQEEEQRGEDLSWLEDLAAAADEEDTFDEPESIEDTASREEIAALASDIPEDPDDAVAWLEQLATEESDELIQTQDDDKLIYVEHEVIEESLPSEEITADVILPKDDEEALQWLDDVVAASMVAAIGSRLPSAEVVDEQVTPKAEFDVEEAMIEAEQMMLEEQMVVGVASSEEVIETAGETIGDEETVVASWLDDLAKDQEAEMPSDVDGNGSEVEDNIDLQLGGSLESEIDSQDVEWLESFDEQPIDSGQDKLAQDNLGIEAELAEAITVSEADLEEEILSNEEIEESGTAEPKEEDVEVDADNYAIAHQLLEEGDFQQAVGVYESILESGEGLPELIADLESAVDKYNSEPALKRVLGEAYNKNGQLQKALEMYRKALNHI